MFKILAGFGRQFVERLAGRNDLDDAKGRFGHFNDVVFEIERFFRINREVGNGRPGSISYCDKAVFVAITFENLLQR